MKLISYVITISILFASIGQVGSDLYLPSLPAIATSLHTNAHLVQATVFLYMIGFSASRLIYGPISDAVGRRKPLITGLIICTTGSIISLIAPSITILMLGRLLQGLGSGAGVVLAGAIVRDLCDGPELAKSYSYMSMANIVLICSAPLIGGYLQYLFNWRASFIFITIYALTALYVATWYFKETNIHKNKDNLRLKNITLNLKSLFNSNAFIGYSMTILLIYAAIIAWLTLGPILLENTLHLTPVDFGWIAAIGGVFYASGVILNTKLLDKYGMNFMTFCGGALLFLAGTIMLAFFLYGLIEFWVIIAPVMLMVFSAGFIFPNAFAGALISFPKIAGIAGAILGFTQVVGGVIASGTIAILPDNTQAPLAIIFIITGFFVMLMTKFAAKEKR